MPEVRRLLSRRIATSTAARWKNWSGGGGGVDAIREGIKRQEEEKEQRAADADALKRAEAGAKAARYRMWKDRRRHVVWCPASF